MKVFVLSFMYMEKNYMYEYTGVILHAVDDRISYVVAVPMPPSMIETFMVATNHSFF